MCHTLDDWKHWKSLHGDNELGDGWNDCKDTMQVGAHGQVPEGNQAKEHGDHIENVEKVAEEGFDTTNTYGVYYSPAPR